MYVMNRIRTEHHSNIYNSTLILIGTIHTVPSERVKSALEDSRPECICYETGPSKGLQPEERNEHKGIDTYEKNNRDVVLKATDVKSISNLLNEESDTEKGFDKDEVYDMTSIGDFKPKSGSFEEDARDSLAQMEAEYPQEYQFFIELRNMMMKNELEKALQKYSRVALVVGIGHLPGIKDRMKID